jgi:HK97 family phage portal protein
MAKFNLFKRRNQIDELRAELTALKERTAKAEANQYPAWALATAGQEAMNPPDPAIFENQAKLYAKLSWMNIAVDYKASSGASQRLAIYQREAEDKKEVVNHKFEMLAERPNPLLSRFELFFNTFSYMSISNTAYWWLNKANEKAEPDEIWVIPPACLEVIPDENMYIKGYWYYIAPGQKWDYPLEPWEIVDFKGFNPFDQFVGLSKVETIATSAEGDLAAQRWNTSFFKDSNGKLPSILAFKDNIQNSDWDIINKDIDIQARKRKMMLLRGVGAGGVEWLQNALSQEDMQFLLGRDFTKEEIWNVLAPGLVSILTKNATEANAKTGKATFAEVSLYPMLVRMHEKITSAIMPSYGEGLIAEFDDPRQSDRMLELAEMGEYSKTHTIDEIRAKHWQDKPLAKVTEITSDDRGILLPAQVSPTTPVPSDEEPEPEPVPDNTTLTPVMDMPPDQQPETPEQEAEREQMEAQGEELAKWKRKAINSVERGKAANVKFVSDSLAADIQASIMTKLVECKTADDVRMAFEGVTYTKPAPVTSVTALLRGIELGVEALKAQKEG